MALPVQEQIDQIVNAANTLANRLDVVIGDLGGRGDKLENDIKQVATEVENVKAKLEGVATELKDAFQGVSTENFKHMKAYERIGRGLQRE